MFGKVCAGQYHYALAIGLRKPTHIDKPTGDTVVLDCGNQIFTRTALASEPEAAILSVQPKIESFLRQLMHNRVPAPGVLRLHQVPLPLLLIKI